MWWGISYWTLAGLGAVSVRLGGRWHLQRRPGNPTCFAPSCAAHSVLALAPSRVSVRGCCGGVGRLFGGAQGAPKRLGGTALKASALPTCAFPHVLSHLIRWVGCRLKFRACN